MFYRKDDDRLNWLERIPAVVTEDRAIPTANDFENIKEYVSQVLAMFVIGMFLFATNRSTIQAFDTSVHPLGELAESLSSVFRDSYSGAGAHKWLLSQAIGDVRSFTRRTYDILR